MIPFVEQLSLVEPLPEERPDVEELLDDLVNANVTRGDPCHLFFGRPGDPIESGDQLGEQPLGRNWLHATILSADTRLAEAEPRESGYTSITFTVRWGPSESRKEGLTTPLAPRRTVASHPHVGFWQHVR